MGRYIFTILPDTNTLYEIERNNGIVTWTIRCAKEKIKVGDEIFIYVGDKKSDKKCDWLIDSMCKRISYKAVILSVLGVGASSKEPSKVVQMHVSRLAEWASEELNREKMKGLFYPPQSYPIDLSETKHSRLVNYIDTVLEEKRIISAIPQTYEERLLNDQNRVVKYFTSKVGRESTKVSGNIAANLIKKYIELVLSGEGSKYKVSPINSFIYGCTTEWDALILKEDAKDVFGCGIYEASDVVAVLEFKASGIFFNIKNGKDTKDALEKFFKTYEELKKNNSGLKAGYITMAEQNPDFGGYKYFDNTKKTFQDKNGLAFCIKESSGKGRLNDNGCLWSEFILDLLPKQ